ncbi:ACT domain-containing protein [Actinomadura sp. ATCC 31491]|uniref:ACT domain-containing protein n=1 Tax=Actinomadura luzonensis TaxID=2805427 RepID=A0ABT0FYA5_9ACTN|nr:ACT domain-containing protein [Actinomadura luzonensis]MCK2216868.1 ACT domain-containing protein [Actinomadura luzonensis]
MLLRVRVTLPDRPGSLAQVTKVLGAAGADITQVTVLDRGAGTALDDLTIFCPETTSRQHLVKSLESVEDVAVEGVWPTREAPGTYPELEILKYITTAGDRALTTLVDSLPVLFSADWAATLGGDRVLYASWRAPQELDLPGEMPARPTALTLGEGLHVIHAPLPPLALALVLARSEGPAFHRIEVHRLTRILEIFLSLPATERSVARQLRK